MIDYFIANQWLFWLIIAGLCLITELQSGTFFILCLAIGALCSMVASLIALPFWVQVLLFALCSAASVYWVRPVVMSHFHGSGDHRASNVGALVGRSGTVSEDIKAGGYGRVKIDGDDWKACSHDGSAIAAGESVVVEKIDSIILTVKKQ